MHTYLFHHTTLFYLKIFLSAPKLAPALCFKTGIIKKCAGEDAQRIFPANPKSPVQKKGCRTSITKQQTAQELSYQNSACPEHSSLQIVLGWRVPSKQSCWVPRECGMVRAVPHPPSGARRASGGEWCPGSTAGPATPHWAPPPGTAAHWLSKHTHQEITQVSDTQKLHICINSECDRHNIQSTVSYYGKLIVQQFLQVRYKEEQIVECHPSQNLH